MLARFRFLLPFQLWVVADGTYEPIDISLDGYSARICRPEPSTFSPTDFVFDSATPLREQLESLSTPSDAPPTSQVLLGGRPTIKTRVLQIDFAKEGEFDRRCTDPSNPDDRTTDGDPPVALAFVVANLFLARLRALLGAAHIHTLEGPKTTAWNLEYLADDGSELPPDPALFRIRRGGSRNAQVQAISEATWTAVREVPEDTDLLSWDQLLLDAAALMSIDHAAAVLLVSAALEAVIDAVLSKLASTKVEPAPALWGWLNHRSEYWREPSFTDQFDAILEILAGASLKKVHPSLWRAFLDLKSARNHIVHGQPTKPALDRETVAGFLRTAAEIVNWLEELVPELPKRPRLQNQPELTIDIELFNQPLATPAQARAGARANPAPGAAAEPAADVTP